MIDLNIKDQRGNVIKHQLGEGKHVLGKSPRSDIIVMDPFCSRHHADLIVTSDGIILVDANSTNGIWINNGRAPEKVKLEYGTVFQIGKLALSVEKSTFSYAVKTGRDYQPEEAVIGNESDNVLDLSRHRKLKKKVS